MDGIVKWGPLGLLEEMGNYPDWGLRDFDETADELELECEELQEDQEQHLTLVIETGMEMRNQRVDVVKIQE